MIRIVGMCGVILVLAAGCFGSEPSQADQYHHYFLVGKRACLAMIKKLGAPPPQSSNGASGLIVLIDTSEYPAQYRKAVSAGCSAATG